MHEGRVATVSMFADVPAKMELAAALTDDGLEDTAAVEMEMAAVAQICKSFSIPFLGLRALSDTMEGDASADFGQFCDEAADSLWPLLSHVLTRH